MNIVVPKGTLVVAVSGGVDSMCLLHMLCNGKYKDTKLVVAHVNHGIRNDADQDEQLVAKVTKNLGLELYTARLNLGVNASEATARTARYAFLRVVAAKVKASAIVTAHHQDDLLETILLHVQRGTGRRGLTPMQTADILRPLIGITKKELVTYAKKHKISWREDSTNAMQKYARNKIRNTLSAAPQATHQKLAAIHKRMVDVNRLIDSDIQYVYNYVVNANTIVRNRFVVLPYIVQKELVYMWLTKNNVSNIKNQLVDSAVIACKTYAVHKKMSLTKNTELVSQQKLIKILQK